MDIGRITFAPAICADPVGWARPVPTPTYTTGAVITKKHPPDKQRVRVRPEYRLDGPGRLGELLTTVMVGQEWAVVKWDDEDDPDCFKLCGLELL